MAATVTSAVYTLLVVDDQPEVVQYLKNALADDRYRVLGVTDPREVLDLLALEHVDLVICDEVMPGIHGTDLLAQIRTAFPAIVRVLLTGHGSLESALSAINRGEVYRYLTKPVTDGEIRAMVDEALGRLDQFRRVAAVERAAQRRMQLMAELEREHTGISIVQRAEGGVYVVDDNQIGSIVAEMADEERTQLFGS